MLNIRQLKICHQPAIAIKSLEYCMQSLSKACKLYGVMNFGCMQVNGYTVKVFHFNCMSTYGVSLKLFMKYECVS